MRNPIPAFLLLVFLALPRLALAQVDPEASQEALPVPPALASPAPVAGPTTPQVHSQYAVLVDAVSGKVLWGRGENTQRQIASTTKIMTAILLLERGHLDDWVVAPPGINTLPESSLHLKPGERIPLRDLLYAMLLRSANDTAVAGADYLSGSVPAFVAQMNAKAKELGATRTHFVTPNGLYAPGHCSTAADLARMAGYAVNTLPLFNEIVRTQKYKVTRSIDVRDEWVRNTSSSFLKGFPGADGIKTGYIHQAGHCFVGSATRIGPDGRPWRLIAVALSSPTCREDVMSLLNYGFANFQPVPALAAQTLVGQISVPSAAVPVPVVAGTNLRAVVSKWRPVPVFQTRVTPLRRLPQAPVAAGTRLGTVTVLANGKPQASGYAVAGRAVPLTPVAALVKTTRRVGRAAIPILSGLLAVATLFLLGVLLYARAAAAKKHRRKTAQARRARLAPAAGAAAKVAGPGRDRFAPRVRNVD